MRKARFWFRWRQATGSAAEVSRERLFHSNDSNTFSRDMLESDWSIRKVFISLYALDSLDGWMNGGLYGYSWLIKNTVGGWGSRETKL